MTRNPIVAAFPPVVLEGLAEVETRLQAMAESREPTLQAWTAEPLAAGGKRVRPLLLLTSFHASGGDQRGAQARDHAIDASVAIELVHTASLVHDDLMDQAAQRRGKPSTYAAHGVTGAILVGDYLFTQAFAVAARLPRAALDITADACRRLSEGQMREQAFQRDGGDRETYAAIIRDKTSALLAAACGIGATLADAPPATVQAMLGFGACIGNAFQVLDDVLDVAGDPKWTGKPAGTDFVAGTLSSPYLHYLEGGGALPDERRRDGFPAVRKALFEAGAVAMSRLEAATHTQAALLALQRLPQTEARDSLERLAELLMERAQ